MEKISVLLISVPLMIVAIVCALFADRIDTVVPVCAFPKNEI